MVDVSIVIPFIHDYPQLIMTLFAVQNEFLDENYSWEIIVVENGEVDKETPIEAKPFSFKRLFRVPISQKRLKYFFEPVQCGPAARQTGVKEASGKYFIFMDSHTVPWKDTFPLLINPLENETADAVHGVVVKTHWDPKRDLGVQGAHYQLFHGGGPKLNSHFHGTYCRARHIIREPGKRVQVINYREPYRVMGASLAYTAYRTSEFLALRGYHPECRFYPHPEGYLPLKWWMMGRECWLHPLAGHFHSNYPRNYGKKIREGFTIDIEGDPYKLMGNDNLLRNAMICAYTLGGEKWRDIVYNFWSKKVRSRYVLDGIREDATRVAQEEHDWVQDNCEKSLDEVLIWARKERIRGMERWLDDIGKDPL